MLTVTTPATNARLTTVAAVRAQFSITPDELNDATVEALINRASDAAASYCNRVFGVESVRETLRDVSNRASIYLDRTPVHVASVAIVEDGVTLASGTDFAFDARRGALLRLINDFPANWSAQKLVIDYAAGYVLPDDDGDRTLPYDIEQAALYLISDLWQQIQNAPEGGYAVRGLTLDGVGAVQYDTPRILQTGDGSPAAGLNVVAKTLLNAYALVAL